MRTRDSDELQDVRDALKVDPADVLTDFIRGFAIQPLFAEVSRD